MALKASINLIKFCREEESQASQQGQIHLQDVPQGRLRDLGVEEPPGSSRALGEPPSECVNGSDVLQCVIISLPTAMANGTTFFCNGLRNLNLNCRIS